MDLEFKLLKSNQLTDGHFYDLSVLLTTNEEESSKRLHTHEYFKWKLDNPFGSSFVVAAYNKEQMVGCLTLTCKPSSSDLEFTQYELGDVMVSEAARGKMLFVKMLRMAIEELRKYDSVVVYGTPNDIAWPHEKRVGFELLENELCYVAFPLNVASYLGKIFNILFFPIGLIFAVISKFLQFLISYLFEFTIKNNAIDGVELNEINEGPILKSLEYLQWRYIDNPEVYFIYSVYLKKKLCSVFVMKKIRYRGVNILFLVDWISCRSANYLSCALILKVFELNIAKYFSLITMSSVGSKAQFPFLRLFYKIKSLRFILLNIGKKVSANIYSKFQPGDGDNI